MQKNQQHKKQTQSHTDNKPPVDNLTNSNPPLNQHSKNPQKQPQTPPQTNPHQNIIFIRHGQSNYNHQAQLLRNKLGIGATWEQYRSSPQFLEFKYSYAMMDCQLSQRGIEQCQKTRKIVKQMFDNCQIGLVLVSPLFRALQSCSIICQDQIHQNTKTQQTHKSQHPQKHIPIIVQPILSQSLRCACDVSYNLFKAKDKFPYYDYSKINGRESLWYIDNQVEGKRLQYYGLLRENRIINGGNKGDQQEDNKKDEMGVYEQTAKFMTKYMEKTFNFQSGVDLMDRARRAKDKIREYHKNYIQPNTNNQNKNNKYNKILIISHYYLIGYLITPQTQFNPQGKPLTKFNVNNATPISYKI